MEVRVIKTCQGFQKLILLDGAVVHPSVEVRDEEIMWTLQTLLCDRLPELLSGTMPTWNVLMESNQTQSSQQS